ncbi:hypothetical protein [Larkinella sp. C7]|jgi:hypothetical protein|uniref:hypothetical protein n=1 Tax=Larkinella sp. C7 TaxID=2576607 RepID=UPI00111136D3|nr:hypothetical protein [Larkinella sp. C7]
MAAKEVTIDDEIHEIERELKMRRSVYPKWTSGPSPTLKPETAKLQMERMESVLARLIRIRNLSKGEQTKLF